MKCFCCHTETDNLVDVFAIIQRGDTQYSYDVTREWVCTVCQAERQVGNAIIKCITCGEVYSIKKDFILGRLEATEFVRKIVASELLTIRIMPGCPTCLKE